MDATKRETDRECEIVLIVAVAENGVIGSEGGIPWHYPADLEHFKETTMGHPVILGRRTFESIVDRIGAPLPGRTNVVLTRSGLDGEVTDHESVIEARDVDEAITAAVGTGTDSTYVAGGATVYEQFLPLADRMVVTEIPERPAGDTHFPEWDREEWDETDRRETDELVFVTYERR